MFQSLQKNQYENLVFFQYPESIYHYSKSMNVSIGKIYEELSLNIMKKFTGDRDSSLWNMSNQTQFVLKKFIVEVMERVQLKNQTDEAPVDIEKIDEGDFKFMYRFYEFFNQFPKGNKDTLHSVILEQNLRKK